MPRRKPGFPWHICMYVMERLWRSGIYCIGESPKLTANASQFFWVGQGLIPICFLVFPCFNDPKNPDILLHTDQILFGVYFPYRIHGTKRISIFTYLDDGFKCILFSPSLGVMIQCHKYFFQMGWFNHQPVIHLVEFLWDQCRYIYRSSPGSSPQRGPNRLAQWRGGAPGFHPVGGLRICRLQGIFNVTCTSPKV